jgi:PAS domain S-box-containing protein
MTNQENHNLYNRKLLTLLAVVFGVGLSLLPLFGVSVYAEKLEGMSLSLGSAMAYAIALTGLFSFFTLQAKSSLRFTGLVGLILLKISLLYLLFYHLHIPLKNEPTNLHHLYGNASSLLVYFHGFGFLLAINLVLLFLIVESLNPSLKQTLEVVPFAGFVYFFIQLLSILLIGYLEGNVLLIDANALTGLLGIGMLVGSILFFRENSSLLYFFPSKSESGFMFRFALVFTVCIPVLLINLFFKTYDGISNSNQLLTSQVLILAYVLIVVSGVFRFSNKVKKYQIEQLVNEGLLIEKNLEISKVNQELDSANKVLAYYNAEIQLNYSQLKASSEIQRGQQDHIEQLLANSLAESENKYKKIFDSHPLPVVLFSIADALVLNANQAAQNLYGYDLEVFKRLTYYNLLSNTENGHSDTFSHLMNEGSNKPITQKHQDLEGNLLVVETLGYQIDYEGEEAYMAVFINVTEKYITDYRFKSLSDSLQVVFFEIDREYNYVYMNKFCEVLVQRTAAELIGTNLLDFLPFYKDSEFIKMVDLTIATNKPQSFLMDVIGPIVEDEYYDVYFYPTLAGVAILSREVTQEKKIQIAFERQQELLNAIVTTIPSLVYVRNLESELFDFANDGLAVLLGDPNYGKPNKLDDIRELVHPADLYMFEEVLAKPVEILKKQPTINVEYRIKYNEKSFIYVNHKLVPFEADENGNLVKVLSVLNSVQDYKQIQTELTLAKSKAEDANVAKSNFLANMSHELRNPLHALSGITQILERDFVHEPKLALYVDLMKQSTSRLLDTIGDILDLSKIEQNKITIQKTNFDLVQLIQNVVKIYSPMAFRKRLTLEFATAFTEVFVNLDPVLIDRVLGNLISNAVKFTFTGDITICLDNFIEGNCQKVVISISDTGIGMSEEFLENYIFKSFEQESGGITKVYEGTGLGLHIIKKYIELQEGTIWVESQKNKGSTFFVMFTQPLREKPNNHHNETENITY